MNREKCFPFALGFLLALTSAAQTKPPIFAPAGPLTIEQPDKSTRRAVTPADYSQWQTLGQIGLSPNGEWIYWLINVQDGNDTLCLTHRTDGKTWRMPRAALPVFSGDNRWLAYRLMGGEENSASGKETGNRMVLLDLLTGQEQVMVGVSRYEFSPNGQFLAASLIPPDGSREQGAVLLLKKLGDSTTQVIGNVTEYRFSNRGDRLAYITSSVHAAGNSVVLLDLRQSRFRILASDTAVFSGLCWDKGGEEIAFFHTWLPEDGGETTLYVYTNLYTPAGPGVLDPRSFPGFPRDLRINPLAGLSFSDDRSAVFFSVRKREAPAAGRQQEDNEAVPAASVEIWHWKDPEIQPHQKNTWMSDRERCWLSVWRPGEGRFIRLAADSLPNALLTGGQDYALLWTENKYKPAFKEDHADYYLVSTHTGERRLIGERMPQEYLRVPVSSPGGRYLFYFSERHWWTYNIGTGKFLNLTRDLKADFRNDQDDHPGEHPPYGFGGWTPGDKALLVYDQYNIWALDPEGRSLPRKLTAGEKEEIRYRIYRTDPALTLVNDSLPVYLATYGERTKRTGYSCLYQGRLRSLLYEDRQISRLTRARDTDTFLYVRADFDLSPELYATGNFHGSTLITATNLRQREFFWGRSVLINYTNTRGRSLQGALFYPANYKPGRKYPMIVHIYEQFSNTLHNYPVPSERSSYNAANFTTAGYFVFRPDIVYDINDPGMSAVHCVLPAVEAVLKTGMIDRNRIGLMGHSWGGYQTSFIITQTDLFRAACAGAPLTDLVSMANSVFWNTGVPDQKLFETDQGRFDGPWYERRLEHIRNSPLYNAEKIRTPLLVAFGDKDGVVDWHQGIELYGTMRRMEKPCVMLVYADENHNLSRKEDQIDYQRRQREWFDHYLLGKPAPAWISQGSPWLERHPDGK